MSYRARTPQEMEYVRRVVEAAGPCPRCGADFEALASRDMGTAATLSREVSYGGAPEAECENGHAYPVSDALAALLTSRPPNEEVGAAGFTEEVVTALVAEVRRLREIIDAGTKVRPGWSLLALPAELASFLEGQAADRDLTARIGGLINEARARRDAGEPVPAPAVDTGTGRWECDEEATGGWIDYYLPGEEDGASGQLIRSPQGQWRCDAVVDGPDDLRAAANIIEKETGT